MKTYYWSDSTTALTWIRSDKEWARFVANRVKEIRSLTRNKDWRHLPGPMNPADVPSRGCSAKKLIDIGWLEGPPWLKLNEDKWPKSSFQICEEDVLSEMKKNVVSSLACTKEVHFMESVLRISDFHKVIRVVALVMRATKLFRKSKLMHVMPNATFLPTLEEIEESEKFILKYIQQSSFNGAQDERLKKLDAFYDQDGLIRIKSQLLFGNDQFNLWCPIVLPHESKLVKLLIRKEHERNSHAGLQALQAILRNQYWILRSRRTIGGVITSCATCRRYLAKRCEVPSAPLPVDRIRNTVAFDITGVDLAGPLFLKNGEKAWIVLYTCAVYRALHLELTCTLSTEGFMKTLRRFVSRRGRPSKIYSDNGLNFVGCNNLFRNVDWNEVQRYASVERIKWQFNAPTAAWWGGWFERLVGLIKQLLRRVLGKKVADYDELNTILCDVEAVINQRPLTYVSDHGGELAPLCPAHFMKDNPAFGLPEADDVDGKTLKKAAKACQQMREDLKSRFRKEYLGQLQHVTNLKNRSVKPGDVVLIEVEDKKRMDWPLGLIMDVYPGRDQLIRTALVKTKNGEYIRPVQRLFILEMSEDSSNQENISPEVKVSRYGRKLKQPQRLGV